MNPVISYTCNQKTFFDSYTTRNQKRFSPQILNNYLEKTINSSVVRRLRVNNYSTSSSTSSSKLRDNTITDSCDLKQTFLNLKSFNSKNHFVILIEVFVTTVSSI